MPGADFNDNPKGKEGDLDMEQREAPQIVLTTSPCQDDMGTDEESDRINTIVEPT